MQNKNVWIVVGIIVIALAGFFIFQKQEPKNIPIVRLGIQTSPAAGLVKVAIEKGFFETEGVKVEVKEFTAGKFALQALIGGSLDLVTPAEFPITLAVLGGEKLSILTEVNETAGGFPMVLRKEGETFDAKTYFAKKRKIGTSFGGGAEFFTADFFKKYNVSASQYELVNLKPEDMPIAMANGDVDGVAIHEPFAHLAIQKTGEDKVFAVKSDDLYSETIVLTANTDWAKQNEETVEKFLRALKKSEDFIKKNPEEAMDIVSSFTKLDKETLRSIWPNLTLSINLDKKLVPTMQKEAQWAKDTGKIKPETAIPNFRYNILETPLKKVSPSAVEL